MLIGGDLSPKQWYSRCSVHRHVLRHYTNSYRGRNLPDEPRQRFLAASQSIGQDKMAHYQSSLCQPGFIRHQVSNLPVHLLDSLASPCHIIPGM